MSRSRFIAAEKACYPIALLCRVLGVARAGYYAWRRRGPSQRAQADVTLTAELVRLHAHSRKTYGAPRLHADLAATGTRVGRKRVARLLRLAGVRGVSRRRAGPRTTIADPAAVPAANLLARQFVAAAPDRGWVGDITYLPTDEGWLYLATLLDVYSRRVVGFALAAHLRTELAREALALARGQRQPQPGTLVHHTDRGSPYTARGYQAALAEHGITPLDEPARRLLRQRPGGSACSTIASVGIPASAIKRPLRLRQPAGSSRLPNDHLSTKPR